MDSELKIIKADIVSQKNWETIEKYMEENLIVNKNLTFVTFCEMYFKKNKTIENDWVGIIHDPEDTETFFPKRNILKNKNFIKSLPYCKGLFCMSNNLKKNLIKEINPDFFVEVLYHPMPNKNLEEFKIDEYKKDKTIIQIGNWLRKTYSIFKLETTTKKEILPFNNRTERELNYFLKKDKILLTDDEYNSVIKKKPVSEADYKKFFKNKVVFLELYSSTANNVILESIKANNPIIINRLDPIEFYLGKEYPLFYSDLSEATSFLENDDLILEAHIYLKQMDKSNLSLDTMIGRINNKLIDI